MARFRLIPQQGKFFENFASLARRLREGTGLLEEMLAPEQPNIAKADEIKACEHDCDRLTHELLSELNRTFVTPLDREDIYHLARTLDDVMDAVDAAAGTVRVYRIAKLRSETRDLARTITRCADELVKAMGMLEERKGLMDIVVEINRLENEADQLHAVAIGSLFDEEKDAITLIKQKEVLNLLEEATDRCEDCANLLEGVVVKYA